MVRFGRFSLIALVCAGLAACLSSSVQSNVDPSYKELLRKVFVLVDSGNWEYYHDSKANKPVLLGEYLALNIEKRLRENNVEAKARSITGLELGTDTLSGDIEQFGANKLMTVKLTAAILNADGLLSRGTFIVTILDTDKKFTFWSAKIEVPNIVVLRAADTIIDKLVGALQGDGLLPSKVATSS